MRNAKDYITEDGPGKRTITSLAYWLTSEGLSDPLTAALLRKSIERSTDDEFGETFDGATKTEARKFLATYELCAMPYWGAEELASAIHDADPGRDEKVALRAVALAQKIRELAEAFKPRQGVEWAMARGYLITRDICQFVGANPGVFGHPHNPLLGERAAISELIEEASPRSYQQISATIPGDHSESENADQKGTQHKLKNRSHPLDAVIARAEAAAADPSDYQSVWAALVEIAVAASRLAPLIGYAEGEGVKYKSDQAENGVGIFTKKALAERYRRKAKSR